MNAVWSCLAFVLICAGHAELWVTAVNRSHGLAWPQRVLKRLRRVHDVAIVGFPVVILAGFGFAAPGEFLSGRWAGLSPLALTTFGASALGLIGLTASTAVWWTRTRPCQNRTDRNEVLDVRKALGCSPIGDGALAWLAAAPGNQQFELDISEKTLEPPRWPAALNGLSILHLSDWHLCPTYRREFYELAAQRAAHLRTDLVAFTGDLFDDPDCLDWLTSTLGRLAAPLGAWFILGNHDSWHDHARFRQALESLGWRDVAGRTVVVDAGPHPLLLAGDETPWMGVQPQWPAADDRPRVLLSHTPDHFPRAAREGVDVVLAGHNHGGQVQLPVIGPVYAPSRYGCRYPAGVFSSGACRMHVSRGLAGRHPLRIGCRPEITRLTIRCPSPSSSLASARNSAHREVRAS
ncbi:MAG: metallophosphoesterase [Planctomyces sp.]|nr:metallophosphoesterase [Planctomyces sp.]